MVESRDAVRSGRTYYSGTMQEDSIAFMTAFCKFKTRDYEVATSMLDDFRRKFGRSVFLEDAEGILALSYFYLAPGPPATKR